MADEKKPKDKQKKAAHDDDVAGKVYDGRLMRRLLTYLRPYKLQTGLSCCTIFFKAGSDVMGPVPGEDRGGHLYVHASAGASRMAGTAS